MKNLKNSLFGALIALSAIGAVPSALGVPPGVVIGGEPRPVSGETVTSTAVSNAYWAMYDSAVDSMGLMDEQAFSAINELSTAEANGASNSQLKQIARRHERIMKSTRAEAIKQVKQIHKEAKRRLTSLGANEAELSAHDGNRDAMISLIDERYFDRVGDVYTVLQQYAN